MFLNGGRDHNVTGNLFVGNFTSSIWLEAIGLSDFMASVNASEFRDLRTVSYREDPWATHYPKLALVDDFLSLPLLGNCSATESCPAAPFGNVFASNVAVNQSTVMLGERPLWQPSELVDGRWVTRGYSPSMILLPNRGHFDPANVGVRANALTYANPGWSASVRLDPDRPCLELTDGGAASRLAPGFARIPLGQVGTAGFRARMGCNYTSSAHGKG